MHKNCPVTYTYNFNNIYIKDSYWSNMNDKDINDMANELGWHTMVIAKLYSND